MHVAHVYDGHEKVYQGRGSVPDVVWNLATESAKHGHQVTVIERQWQGLDAVSSHEGVTFRRVSLRTGATEPWDRIPYEMLSSPLGATRLVVDQMNFALSALSVLRGLSVDAIHVHLPFAANVLVTIAPSLRDRTVFTAHLGETEKRVLEPMFSPDVYLAKRAARTIALNPTIRDAFLSRGVPAESLPVIPNGVDLKQFEDVNSDHRSAVAETFGVESSPVILFVGTVTPRKGVAELIAAATEVLEGEHNAEFIVVGQTDLEPAYVDRIQWRVKEAEMEDHVTFTGFVKEEQLHALYDLADIFVLPSHEEGSSISVNEAITAGLPVVGSRIDGTRQSVEDGTHGALVKPRDVGRLASRLNMLLDDKETQQRMQSAVAERAEELSWEHIAKRNIDVYEEVVGG